MWYGDSFGRNRFLVPAFISVSVSERMPPLYNFSNLPSLKRQRDICPQNNKRPLLSHHQYESGKCENVCFACCYSLFGSKKGKHVMKVSPPVAGSSEPRRFCSIFWLMMDRHNAATLVSPPSVVTWAPAIIFWPYAAANEVIDFIHSQTIK